MNPGDDCSAYYPVPKSCKTSKWNDPFIYDMILVMHVTYWSQMSMCKSKIVVAYNYRLWTFLPCRDF